uniref:Family with sequence similarity 110 member C n=1 Tax=Xenopus tropicalis TaxID=8364 RepID=F6RY45_XENTR
MMYLLALSPAVPLRLLTRGPDYLRRQMEALGSPRANLSAVERLAADKAKYVKTPHGSSRGSQQEGTRGQQGTAPVRRGSSKRSNRPDSLVIYRLKSRGEGQQAEPARVGLVRRLFLKEKPPGSAIPVPPQEHSTPCPSERLSPEKEKQDSRSRTGLHRSQSDISSRYSRSFSDFDSFFQYCGLEPEVVEELGRDRFSPAREERLELLAQSRIRSVSVATSESGMSWRSEGEGSLGGLQEDEPLSGQLPGANSTTSVIERNARIIKWLYGCKRAKETRGGSPDLP